MDATRAHTTTAARSLLRTHFFLMLYSAREVSATAREVGEPRPARGAHLEPVQELQERLRVREALPEQSLADLPRAEVAEQPASLEAPRERRGVLDLRMLNA